MKDIIFRRNGYNDFWDNAIDGFFRPMFYEDKPEGMDTDIQETDEGYSLEVELPGFDKSEIELSLENGYLTIEAHKEEKSEEGEKEKKYLRRERRVQCSRSYYVGENLTEDDIKAKYDKGVLSIDVPKDSPKKIEAKKIEIE